MFRRLAGANTHRCLQLQSGPAIMCRQVDRCFWSHEAARDSQPDGGIWSCPLAACPRPHSQNTHLAGVPVAQDRHLQHLA